MAGDGQDVVDTDGKGGGGVLLQDEGDLASRELRGLVGDDDGCAGGGSPEQETDGLPVQGEQHADALRAAVTVDQQVRGLGDPVEAGRAGELDARRSVVQRQEGGGEIAVGNQAARQVLEQMLSAAVRTLVGAGVPVGEGVPVTVTVLAVV